jgi:hypothetical protein
MSYLECNIFPIANLNELKSSYRLYRIRGLSPEQEEYHHNVQILVRELSFGLRSPVTIVTRDSEPYLVLREDSPEPPDRYSLVRTTAYFDKTESVFVLDYENRTEETEPICQRFLQFAIQGALRTSASLWQPGAGKPFFEQEPVHGEGSVNVYRGYAVRVVLMEGGKIGVCVDVRHRYVSQAPLPADISKGDFRKIKGMNCVYHYGNRWYDIKLHEHSGLTVSEYMIDGRNLLDYVLTEAPKPLPKEVVSLPNDCSAVVYLTSQHQPHAAPAGLCYPVFETDDPRIERIHRRSILKPCDRRSLIHNFVKDHLKVLRFQDTVLRIQTKPVEVPERHFIPPDLAFGHDTVYSVRGTAGAIQISPDVLGRTRLSALFNREIGPYITKPLDRQYLIWPKSVANSYGPAFLENLKEVVNELYPGEIPYDPNLIAYEDQVARTFVAQGNAVLRAVDAAPREPGYGIVMIHETSSRRIKGQDQLTSMVMRELRERGIYVSVIHTTVSRHSYVSGTQNSGAAVYQLTEDKKQRKRFISYLRNVAITKILLTNERWPFVLETPLHADLTIGIDVKLHTACFTLLGKKGPDVRTVCRESMQKERLAREQVKTILSEVLRGEAELWRKGIRTIVVHRDGRLFASEVGGIKDAIEIMQKENALGPNMSVNFVEIPKTSPAHLRLFDVTKKPDGREFVENPQVGSYYVISPHDAYLCPTGRPFDRPGTANPLHISYREGDMPIERVLEDIYALTCLAWTRPEDCTRYPVTVKLTDIRLREHSQDYDTDAVRYGEESEEGGSDE